MKKQIFSITVLVCILLLAGWEKEERKELHISEEDSVMEEWIRELPPFEGKIQSEAIRGISVEKDGEELFTAAYEPKDYKLSFDYWEITAPYTSLSTVNTETLYTLLGQLDGLEITGEEEGKTLDETGIADSKTYITLALSNKEEGEEADSVWRLCIGDKDGKGNIYVSEGDKDTAGLLPESAADTLLSIDPYDYILKIPVLPNITTVSSVEVESAKGLYTMSAQDGTYRMDSHKADEEEYNEAFQRLLNILIAGELPEKGEEDTQKEPILTVRFFRNTEEASDIEVIYYPYDEEYVEINVNGSSFFLAERKEVESLCEYFFDT